MTYEKSKAYQQFELETHGLIEDLQAERITVEEYVNKMLAALNRNMFDMNEQELTAFKSGFGDSIMTITDILTRIGRPVPGTDPNQPN